MKEGLVHRDAQRQQASLELLRSLLERASMKDGTPEKEKPR